MEIRDYQQTAIDDLTMALANGHRRLLLVMPTGSGKTHVAAAVIKHAFSNQKKVLFLCHRREIAHQTLEKLDIPCSLMLSGEPYDPTKDVQVISIPTFHPWCIRKKKERLPKADLIFFDEVHHQKSSRTWQDIEKLYPEAVIVGMTATPIDRAGHGMGKHYDFLVKGPSIRTLTDQGFLLPTKYYVPSKPDLEKLHIRQGDYVEKELENRMDKVALIGDICENWSRICPTRKTLVFGVGIKHSIHLAEGFSKIGIKAAHIDGHTPKIERDKIIKEFSEGDLQVLCNCQCLTEGVDLPSASCLILARPTKSLLLYLQIIGRGLRPFPGQKDCIILDHAGIYEEHGSITQDWDWKLDYQEETVGSVMSRARKEKKKRSLICGNCKLVYEFRLDCPSCGWKPVLLGKPVETYEGYLHALDELELEAEVERKPIDPQVFYTELLGYCASKGKKPGLAYYKFIEKFGYKPRWTWRELPPIEPSLETKAWIQSRMIRWAYSHKRNSLTQHNTVI